MATATPRSAYGRDRGSSYHPSQILALVIGAVFTLIGIAGFFVTGFDDFAEVTDETLLGFEVNPLHNIVHLILGLAGLAMWRSVSGAKAYGWALLVGYGAVFVYGLFAVDEPDANFLSLNDADNWLHLVTAAAGLATALWPARRTAATHR